MDPKTPTQPEPASDKPPIWARALVLPPVVCGLSLFIFWLAGQLHASEARIVILSMTGLTLAFSLGASFFYHFVPIAKRDAALEAIVMTPVITFIGIGLVYAPPVLNAINPRSIVDYIFPYAIFFIFSLVTLGAYANWIGFKARWISQLGSCLFLMFLVFLFIYPTGDIPMKKHSFVDHLFFSAPASAARAVLFFVLIAFGFIAWRNARPKNSDRDDTAATAINILVGIFISLGLPPLGALIVWCGIIYGIAYGFGWLGMTLGHPYLISCLGTFGLLGLLLVLAAALSKRFTRKCATPPPTNPGQTPPDSLC